MNGRTPVETPASNLGNVNNGTNESNDVVNSEQKIRDLIQEVLPINKRKLPPNWALIVVDIQNDFINGSMAIKDGADVVPAINRLLNCVNFDLVIFSRDWHPKNHCSFLNSDVKAKNFNSNFKKFPQHCIKNTRGARYDYKLNIRPPYTRIVHVLKGYDKSIECFSVFGGQIDTHRNVNLQANKPIKDIIKHCNINTIFICGLATNICVLETAKDAKKLFKNSDIYLLLDCSQGTKPFADVYQTFLDNQIKFTTSDKLIQGCLSMKNKLQKKFKKNIPDQDDQDQTTTTTRTTATTTSTTTTSAAESTSATTTTAQTATTTSKSKRNKN